MPNQAVLRAQRDRLIEEVAHEKREVRRHKSKLQVAASALTAITELLATDDSTSTPLGVEGDDLHGHHARS